MYDNSKINGRSTAFWLDLTHIIIGILVVLMAGFTFLNPEQNLFLFPIVFFLAAGLKFINGTYRLKRSGREKRKKISGIVQILVALFLLAMMAVSGISIWRY